MIIYLVQLEAHWFILWVKEFLLDNCTEKTNGHFSKSTNELPLFEY